MAAARLRGVDGETPRVAGRERGGRPESQSHPPVPDFYCAQLSI